MGFIARVMEIGVCAFVGLLAGVKEDILVGAGAPTASSVSVNSAQEEFPLAIVNCV